MIKAIKRPDGFTPLEISGTDKSIEKIVNASIPPCGVGRRRSTRSSHRDGLSLTGFTLIELMVVITIIVILASLTMAGLPRILFRVRMTKCHHNLKVLYTQLIIYTQENNNAYPRLEDGYSGAAFWNALRTGNDPLLKRKDYKMFVCPIKGGEPGLGVCDYKGPVYKVTSGVPSDYPLAADNPVNHHPKSEKPINVLYFDGDIIEVKPGTPEWDQTLPEAKLLAE